MSVAPFNKILAGALAESVNKRDSVDPKLDDSDGSSHGRRLSSRAGSPSGSPGITSPAGATTNIGIPAGARGSNASSSPPPFSPTANNHRTPNGSPETPPPPRSIPPGITSAPSHSNASSSSSTTKTTSTTNNHTRSARSGSRGVVKHHHGGVVYQAGPSHAIANQHSGARRASAAGAAAIASSSAHNKAVSSSGGVVGSGGGGGGGNANGASGKHGHHHGHHHGHPRTKRTSKSPGRRGRSNSKSLTRAASSSITFKKEPVGASPGRGRSRLAASLSEPSHTDDGGDSTNDSVSIGSDAGRTSRGRGGEGDRGWVPPVDDPALPKTKIVVKLKFYPYSMNMTVPKGLSVKTVISRLIAEYNARHVRPGEDQLIADPDLFCFRLLEDDGEIDTDIPAVPGDQAIGRVGETEFALTENPKFRGATSALPPAERKRATSNPKLGARGGIPPTATFVSARDGVPLPEGAGSGSGSGSGGGGGGGGGGKEGEAPRVNRFCKVHMPGGEYTVASMDKPMTVGELSAFIAKRRQLVPSEWKLVYAMGKDERLDAADKILTIDVRKELRFVPSKPATKGHTRAESNPGSTHAVPVLGGADRPESFLFSEVTASKYEEYPVTKINSKGKRQERVLGIDREKIYNSLPKSGKAGLFTGSVKRPERLVDDVLGVGLIENVPGGFYMDFKDADEKDGVKLSKFEAESPAKAAEIVAKMMYLMKLSARRSKEMMDPLSPRQRR